MNEGVFHLVAGATLDAMFQALERVDAAGEIDVEYQDGVMTIELDDGRQFIVSKHTPSRQLWLSSPVSGGLHFSYAAAGGWQLSDGRTLSETLCGELKSLAKIEVKF